MNHVDTVDSPPSASSNSPSSDAADRGACLCLSGGGFRATLFHLGVIQRLNELGVLARLSTITSVSGGSILNGLLASRWSRLKLGPNNVFSNLDEIVAQPMRQFCGKDLRTPILLGTRLNPLKWRAVIRDRLSVSADFLADGYEPLMETRLGELPAPGPQSPRFVFCATNVKSGACWHFHGGPQARMGDFYGGYCDAAHVRVSDAVAASSSFPPGFSALRLSIPTGAVFSREDPWGELRVTSVKRPQPQQGVGQETVLLTDGGVYDNLAVEPVWKTYKTVLVSDAGRPFESVDNCGQGIVSRLKRAADISMEQVAAVRKRWLVDEFLGGRRIGAIWTLHTRLADFPLSDKCGYGEGACKSIQKIRTDLDAFSEAEIACLENHGYSLADAALRSRAPVLCVNSSHPFQWPRQKWSDDEATVTALGHSGTRKILRDAFRYLAGS